jgi:hypothetical protein
MHWCVASVTTATPCGLSTASRQDAISAVLDLQSFREHLDQARQLGNADHAVARQVADVDAADDRRHVMFAVRLEADVAQHHDLVVTAGLLEGA